jgi:DNA invertase Pin-like site-specific DNA recombinase
LDILRINEIRNLLEREDKREVAYKTGLSHQTIYNVLNKKSIGLNTLRLLIEYFKLNKEK